MALCRARRDPLIDVVTAAAIRLADGTPVALAVSGVSPGARFALTYYGEQGRLHATDQHLDEERTDTPPQDISLPPSDQTIDSNFVAALASGSPLCCSAAEALETVRLLEAIGRSATTGQIVRIS